MMGCWFIRKMMHTWGVYAVTVYIRWQKSPHTSRHFSDVLFKDICQFFFKLTLNTLCRTTVTHLISSLQCSFHSVILELVQYCYADQMQLRERESLSVWIACVFASLQYLYYSKAAFFSAKRTATSPRHNVVYIVVYTVGEKIIWSPADFVCLPTDKEIISL